MKKSKKRKIEKYITNIMTREKINEDKEDGEIKEMKMMMMAVVVLIKQQMMMMIFCKMAIPVEEEIEDIEKRRRQRYSPKGEGIIA